MPPAAPLPCNSASISERRATPVLAMASGPPVAKIAISASSLAAIDVKEAGPGVSASMDSLAASMKGLNMRKSTTTGDTDSSENESPLSQTDTPKETESPRFQALLRMTGGDRSRKDIKSYSHELDPKGVRLNDHWRPHSSNDIEEILVTLRSRFNSAKEKVDTELKVFAGNLVEILESAECADLSFQEGVEDLLVLARKCATMPPTYFRRECEAIVQEVDDRRQELPVGTLKQLHTKMLFILTRCTRLLQFEKQSGLDENGALHILHQKSEEVPAADRAWAVKASGRASFNDRRVLFSHRRVSNVIGRGSEAESSSARFSKSFEDVQTHDRSTISKQETILGSSTSDGLDVKQKSLPTSKKGTASLPSSLEAPGRTFQDQVRLGSECHLQPLTQRNGLTRNDLKSDTNLTRVDIASNGLSKVICRICDEEIASVCLEEHSRICAYVDRFDYKTLNTDERLLRLAELLERLLDLHNTTCSQSVVRGSGGDVQASTSSASEVDHGRNLSHLREAIHDCATRSAAQSDDIVNETSSSKCAQFLAPTGRSLTRITSQSDLSMACRISQFESGDLTQIAELADIARCVANANLNDGGGLEYLQSCMEDLEEALQQSKAVALTVFTFGRRIQGLVREKYLTTCDAELSSSDEPDVDGAYEEDAFRSTPVHPAYLKDRTTIEDFEIIKPISRGAFGRVFLARKRTTGDLFAIKILRKSDMMRKNAVESVQAERNILISVRNPFVVRFFYSFTCKDNLYLVMEYLNGGDLYSMLRNLGCLEEDMARTYIAELVLALEYLHSLGVVHRDLKPDNLLIAHDGHIKLTDFGLSRVGLINSTEDLSGPAPRRHLHESPQHREQPRDRSAVGTPDYLAPEILLGTGHGSTADWWSVGVILFELLTGVPPFNAEHPRVFLKCSIAPVIHQIIFDNILNRNIPWPYVPEDMSFEAQDLIDRLLTWDPSQRLGAQGAEEVKAHPFFKDVQWDTLARQKAAFIPSLNSADDTSYFTSRHIWNSNSPEVVGFPNGEIGDSSDCGSSSGGSSNSMCSGQEDGGDKCGDLADFDVTPSVKYSFSDFSYKNLSQLAEINYDLLLKTGEELK